MSVYTFSTKGTRPADTEDVEAVKQYCDQQGMHFSALVVKLIKEWKKENLDEHK